MIYAAWPAFLYTNPAIGRYLLEPVLAYQAANPVQDGYSIRDIGKLARVSEFIITVTHNPCRGFTVSERDWTIEW